MKLIAPIIVSATLVAGMAGCTSEPRRDYAYRSGYYHNEYPTRSYAYSGERGYYANGVYHPPASTWNYGTSSDNYYASRSDYYRNYQGIHGGPERTDGP